MTTRTDRVETADRAIDRAVELLDAGIGLRPEPSFRSRLARCMSDEAATRALDVHDYVELVAADPDVLQRLLNRVTVQETDFFRHPTHFEVLRRNVLPAVDGPVTIWCAACANGQEAYSLAMILEEDHLPGTVVASDVSTEALERTTAASYATRELSGLSPDRRERHLDRAAKGWVISPEVRKRVLPMRHNLLDPIPEKVGACRVVFCRNVLIYFSAQHAATFLGRLADRMAPDSYLFVGGAETLWQVTDRFEPVVLGSTFVYRPTVAATPRKPAMPAMPANHEVRHRPTARRRSRERSAPSTRTTMRSRTAPSEATDLEREGGRLLSEGAYAEAIATFRKWAYAEPGAVMAHLNLGLALERTGDYTASRAAYMSARAALRDCDPASIEHALGGYRVEEMSRLLDLKLGIHP